MLAELRPLRSQLVFYESPQRLAETLLELKEALGDRPALVARELTKVHEEIVRGTLGELAARFSGETRGEVAIVVSGAGEPQAPDPAELEQEVRDRLARGERPKAIAEALAGAHGKREVYQLALRLSGER
jgi:16S rRNA (cytidine1402-2'-O)-methyltransferase